MDFHLADLIGAMPVGLGTMRRLSETLGPAPRAFLVITLAASLFADAANAIASRRSSRC